MEVPLLKMHGKSGAVILIRTFRLIVAEFSYSENGTIKDDNNHKNERFITIFHSDFSSAYIVL